MPLLYSTKTLGCLCVALPLGVLAQDSEKTTVDAVLEQYGADVSRHVPTNRKGLEESAKTGVRALTPQQQQKLDLARERAKAALAKQASFHKQVAEGTLIPEAKLRAGVELATQRIPKLLEQFDAVKQEQDVETKMALNDALLAAIQPIGQFLATPNPVPTDLRITEQQKQQLLSERERMWESYKSPNKIPIEKRTPLQFVSYQDVTTLIDLYVPVVVKGAPNSEIYIASETGGRFPNGLPFITIKADNNGIAQTRWVTHGDCVGPNIIHAVSSTAPATSSLLVNIQELKPRALVHLASKAQN